MLRSLIPSSGDTLTRVEDESIDAGSLQCYAPRFVLLPGTHSRPDQQPLVGAHRGRGATWQLLRWRLLCLCDRRHLVVYLHVVVYEAYAAQLPSTPQMLSV